MIYILENDRLKVKVSSMGAELQSIRRREDDTEYLWQGDATFWPRRATNLFPVCGRMIDGKYTYDGVTYDIPNHGFAKLMEWSVVHQKATALTLQLKDTEESRKMYPFRFALEIAYTLAEESLSVALILHNLDDKTMFFALGGHPGFNVPLTEGEAFEDYEVVFDEPCQPRRLDMSERCYYLETASPYPLADGKSIALRHNLFDDDAIFLRDTAKGVTLRSKTGPRSVHMAFPDMKFIGLWHKPHSKAPFVCIEPWLGAPASEGELNALEAMPEMEKLAPGETYRNVYTMTFR